MTPSHDNDNQGESVKGIFRTASARSTKTLVKKTHHQRPADHPSSYSGILQSSDDPVLAASGALPPPGATYWPLELLPRACPTTRVMVWGCHSIVMNGKLLRSQNSIFAHSEDLLRELADFRDETDTSTRSIVFVAHSTGGIIVKEVTTDRQDAARGMSYRLTPRRTRSFAAPKRNRRNESRAS